MAAVLLVCLAAATPRGITRSAQPIVALKPLSVAEARGVTGGFWCEAAIIAVGATFIAGLIATGPVLGSVLYEVLTAIASVVGSISAACACADVLDDWFGTDFNTFCASLGS
jgi:hypothetical protein